MRLSTKLGLTALMAALLLSAAVSTASARNLSSSTKNIRATWARLEFVGGLGTRMCQVTLEGSYHERTIVKSWGSLIGAVTRVDVKRESCTGGEATPLVLPWHITYEGFTGTLPTITSVRLLLARFRYSVRSNFFGVTCQIGTATDNVVGSVVLNAS